VILSSAILQKIYPPAPGNETIRLIVEILSITLTLLIIGEVIPKIYATKNALKFSLAMGGALFTLGNLPPISWLKSFLVNGSNIIHKKARRKGIKISSDELEQALALTKEDHTSNEEHKILEGIVKFGNTEVCQIMRSRMDVVALEDDLKFTEIMPIILESGYSRIPVFKENFDNVIGILFVKDLLPYLNQTENEEFNWIKLIRKPFFVPENKKIDDLLKEFQVKKVHMAVVVDEYGGSSGVCTLEDILEEIVGDITDEFDDDEIAYTKIDERTYIFEGKTALVDLYKVINIDGREFESKKGDADSVGGFIVENIGRIPSNKEYIDVEEFRLIVESSDKRRVKLVKVVCPQSHIKTND
jgi:gliding motility-associated protein GldE